MDVDDIMSTSSFRKFGGASNSNIWDADETPMIQTPTGDSGYQPEISNDPAVDRHAGHEKYSEWDSRSHGVPEQLSPGHGLTTRIAQLRRELGARGAELETAKEQLAKILGHHQMLKAEVADKDVKQQLAKMRNQRRIVDDKLAELYEENQSFRTILRRQRRAIKEAELDSKEYIDEFEEIKKEKKKAKTTGKRAASDRGQPRQEKASKKPQTGQTQAQIAVPEATQTCQRKPRTDDLRRRGIDLAWRFVQRPAKRAAR